MSEAETDPNSTPPDGGDPVAMDAQDLGVAGETGDRELNGELGEALGEALTEAASLVAEEALAEAEHPRRRKKRTKAAAKSKNSRLGRVDGTMALVLLANLLFMGLVLFLPDPMAKPDTPEVGGPGVETPVTPRVAPTPPATPAAGLESRVIQLAEIEGLVRLGRFEEAIQKIEATLRDHPDLPPMVRRSLYSRLANYYAESGNHDKALQYLKLSSNGFQMSLLPKDLWKMAQDASKLGDQPGARKYLARFLLQESLMGDEMETKIPAAYLRLGDGYRIQAAEAEKKGEAK